MMVVARIGLALSLLFVGECGTEPTDAGPGDSAAGSGRIQIRFEADEEDRPDGWELVSAHVELDQVRLDNDRGDGFEPAWTRPDGSPLGRTRLDEDPPEAELRAVPATYGGVALISGDAPTLELVYRVEEARVEVTSDAPFDIMTRCQGGGTSLQPGGSLTVEVRLDVGRLARVLADDLTPPATGTVFVDAGRSEETLTRVEAELADAWITRCEADDDDDDDD
ncbi:MAG: hypothetical protein AB8I08_11970 [Sandaracinaceae bacterium]